MKDKLKVFFSSELFYQIIRTIADFLVDVSESLIKQWLGTVIGQRFFKWLTDILVDRFYDQTIRVFVAVGVIRMGYKYDVHNAEIIITKLNEAEAANDQDLYMRTLNDALRRRVQ